MLRRKDATTAVRKREAVWIDQNFVWTYLYNLRRLAYENIKLWLSAGLCVACILPQILLLLRSMVLDLRSAPGRNHAPSFRWRRSGMAFHPSRRSAIRTNSCTTRGSFRTAATQLPCANWAKLHIVPPKIPKVSGISTDKVASISRISPFGWCARTSAQPCARHIEGTNEKHTKRGSREQKVKSSETRAPLKNDT